GGMKMDTERLLTRGQMTYAEGSPAGAYDPVERLRVMDGEGIDAVLLYPTIGICWEGHVTDADLATAYARAYNRWLADFCRTDPSDGLFGFAFLAIDVMAAFTQMLSAGMFERYPRLKCAVLEAGSNWIAAWLDRLDHKYRVMKHQTPIRLEPSAYFYRQCMISADPDESVTAQMVERLGADYFIWASDYPHID